MMKGKEKLESLVSEYQSGWREKAEWRVANIAWLKKSEEIAAKVLHELRKKGMTQKELAEQINVSAQYVSKLVKGHENLSLETIAKLEEALDVTLITVPFTCRMEVLVPACQKMSSEVEMVPVIKYTRDTTFSEESGINCELMEVIC